MRPVTNRGLRRKRPPRTRATVTRIVSSPLPSLPTDTGAGYMSLSTRPFPCRFARARESAIRVPTSVHHRPLEYVVDGADREDRNRSTRRAMDSRRPDELPFPDAGRPLPLLEIGDLHRLAFERVPPFVRRESGVPDRALGLLYRRSRSLEQGASQTDSETAGRRRSARGETELDQIPPGPRSRRLRIVVLRQSHSLHSSTSRPRDGKRADRLKLRHRPR